MVKRFLRLGLMACLLTSTGCTTGEGERCNPLRFSDDCAQGTSCVYPKNCAVAYCCPPQDKLTPQTSSTCQACPPPDGGTTD